MSFQNDFEAIKDFNTKDHCYLTVVGKGKDQHLVVEKRSLLGRLWMHLGFSDSSIGKVAKYINDLNSDKKFIHELNMEMKNKEFNDQFTKLKNNLLNHYINQTSFGMVSQSGVKADNAYNKLWILTDGSHCSTVIKKLEVEIENQKKKISVLQLAAQVTKDTRALSKMQDEIIELQKNQATFEEKLKLAKLSESTIREMNE